ncbi:MAG: RNA methyltransferase [Bacteroidota bacterium]
MRKLKNEELNRPSLEDYKTQRKNDVVIILDNIRSLNNVGSAFRTSDAFNIEKIFLCGITGTPPHRDIHKTALGATDSVAWEHVQSTENLIKRLKGENYQVYAIEQTEGAIMLDQFVPNKGDKYCFVFGNEVFGVSQEAIDACNECLEIPQYGTKHSLNISVCIGVVLWDFLSKN